MVYNDSRSIISTSSSSSSSRNSSKNNNTMYCGSRANHESAMALHCRLEELKDVFTTMRRQEATIYNVPIPDDDDESWRPLMVEWMYNIVDIFQVVPQVVGTAMKVDCQLVPGQTFTPLARKHLLRRGISLESTHAAATD